MENPEKEGKNRPPDLPLEKSVCRVKHNDQIAQPSENGVIVRGRRTSPAYAPAFIDAVKSVTGDRYVKPAEKK